MSQPGIKSSIGILLGRQGGISARHDIEWERIMVQITFAFVIILGYLISVEMQQSQQLAAQARQFQKSNAALSSIVASLRDTELGKERALRVAAETELQLQRLLRAWDDVQERRELHRALIYFDDAEQVDLSDDLDCLPVDGDFASLTSEVERVFFAAGEEIASRVVRELVRQSIEQAGYDPRTGAEIDAAQDLPPQARELYFNERVPTAENRRFLETTIRQDLMSEREQLIDIQEALVQQIAAARLRKLAALPLDQVVAVPLDSPELGAAMLDSILAGLRTTIKLLPETAARIRGTAESVSTDVSTGISTDLP